MTVFSSGISMYAMGALLALLLGWNIHACIVMSAVVVLLYISLGGLTSAIYNEVLQFFLIVFGFAPLVYLGLRDAGGWEGLRGARAGDVRALVDVSRTRRRPTRWASSGSAWSWASDSSCRSATGAPTSWSCSARWPPIR